MHRDDGQSAPPAPAKKPYRSPRLQSYGDLQRITAGIGGKKADATPPGGKSKV
jgi:hypothetical protein